MSLPSPVGVPELSVADRLRANFAAAQSQRTQEFEFPPISGLYIVFRTIEDFGEAHDTIMGNPGLPAAQQEIAMAINLLVASSIDSYAIVDGDRHDIGLKLGVDLYDLIFPAEEGQIRPRTDGEAVALMFGADTLSLVMFSRKLNTLKKIQSALVEADPGKS